MTPRLADIARFMEARHRIYLRRKAGEPGPWTSDPILLSGRFCNIFRELDTVTMWIDEHIRKPFADHEYLWFMLCIARYINWPETLAVMIEMAETDMGLPTWPSNPKFDLGEKYIATRPAGFDASSVTWALHQCAKRHKKVYTGAYMIRAESDPTKEWYSWSKHKYIAEIVLGRLWEDRHEWTAMLEDQVDGGMTLEDCWTLFQNKRYIGWGPFMAYEVVTDLRHTRYLNEAPDIYEWANAGPGAIRGLNRLYGRDLNTKPRPEQTNAEMLELMKDLNSYDDMSFTGVFGGASPHPLTGYVDPPRFEMRDIEHTLCEWDKYERVRLGQGKMRAKYDWRKATKL